MNTIAHIPFIFLGISFLSLWLRREAKTWGPFLGLSVFSGLLLGNIDLMGLGAVLTLLLLWVYYVGKPVAWKFIAIVALSLGFKLHIIPGFYPYFVTPKFTLGLQSALVGLFPLAFVVPLARSLSDWKEVFMGFAYGCLGIAAIALIAVITGVAKWHYSPPPFMEIRLLSNLILTAIPEEGFFRGFVQQKISDRFGNLCALLITSVLFTLAHLYWSPNPGVLAFTFIASLLYGGVYLISKRVESAILTHFLFNVIHMTFFSYHAA